jgi:hypothetical protein
MPFCPQYFGSLYSFISVSVQKIDSKLYPIVIGEHLLGVTGGATDCELHGLAAALCLSRSLLSTIGITVAEVF